MSGQRSKLFCHPTSVKARLSLARVQVFTLLRSRKELRRMQQHPVPDALLDPADVPQYAADGLPRPRRKLRSKYEAPGSRQAWQPAASSSWSEAQPVADRGPRHTEPPARLTEEQLQVRPCAAAVLLLRSPADLLWGGKLGCAVTAGMPSSCML